MRRIGTMLSLLLLTALVVFVVQNLGSVRIRFLGWGASLSLAAPVLLAYLLGGITMRPILRLMRKQRKDKKTQREADKRAQEKLQQAVAEPEASKESQEK
jgi:uncharacterized integral membrane protein